MSIDADMAIDQIANYMALNLDQIDELIALVRALERVRVAAERTLDVPVMPGIDCQKVAENGLRKALAAVDKIRSGT